MLGGAEGLLRWVREDPKNLRDFYTKICIKLIDTKRDVKIETKTHTYEDVLKNILDEDKANDVNQKYNL